MQDSYDNWKKYNPKTDEWEVVDNINNLNEGDVVSYPSARFSMYKQQIAEDNVIQDKINNYIEKGKLI